MAFINRRSTASGGDRWDVRWRNDAGRVVGKTFRTRRDAEAFRRQVDANELVGLIPGRLRGGDEALKAYAGRWLESRLVKGRPLSPMTRQGYRGLLDRNIFPAFGETAVRKITPEDVRGWYSRVVAEASRDQAAKSYRLLHAILETAVDDGVVARNPCRIKGAGDERAPERPMVDASTVLALASAMEPRLRALVLLAGFGGLRTGESLGLRRRDVDLVGRRVSVEVQAQQVVGAGRLVTGPKSEAGRRVVALPRPVVDALEAHLEAGYAEAPHDGAMFTGARGGPVRRQEVSRAWRSAVAAVEGAPAGLHLHDLRHHAATSIARMPGITLKELMARIGHSTPRAALRYQHATAERDAEIAAFLDSQIEAVSGVVSLSAARERVRQSASAGEPDRVVCASGERDGSAMGAGGGRKVRGRKGS